MNTGTLGTEGHEPVSSLALKAEKQEAEGGDRKWLAGEGTTRVSWKGLAWNSGKSPLPPVTPPKGCSSNQRIACPASTCCGVVFYFWMATTGNSVKDGKLALSPEESYFHSARETFFSKRKKIRTPQLIC